MKNSLAEILIQIRLRFTGKYKNMSECQEELYEIADRMTVYLNCVKRIDERRESSEQIKNILRLAENFCALYKIRFSFEELAQRHEPEVYLNARRFSDRFISFIEEFRRGEHQWAGIKSYQSAETKINQGEQKQLDGANEFEVNSSFETLLDEFGETI